MAIPCGYMIDNGGLDTFGRGCGLPHHLPQRFFRSPFSSLFFLSFAVRLSFSFPSSHSFACFFSFLFSFLPSLIRSPFASLSLLSLIRSPFAVRFFLFAVSTRPTDRPAHPLHRMGGTAAAARRGRKRTGGPSGRHGAEVGFGVVRQVRVWGFGSILGKKQVNKEV